VVLKDIQCCDCGRVREMMLDSDETWVVTTCSYCEAETRHESLCNGGAGKRFRFNDWDGVDFRGQVKAMPPTAHVRDAETGEETVVTHGTTGEPMQDDPRFHGDRREERRDRVYHKHDKRQGKTPLYFDQGS